MSRDSLKPHNRYLFKPMVWTVTELPTNVSVVYLVNYSPLDEKYGFETRILVSGQ